MLARKICGNTNQTVHPLWFIAYNDTKIDETDIIFNVRFCIFSSLRSSISQIRELYTDGVAAADRFYLRRILFEFG